KYCILIYDTKFAAKRPRRHDSAITRDSMINEDARMDANANRPMSERRAAIDLWIEQGAFAEAHSGLGELLAAEGLANATAAFALARYERLRPHMPLVSYRVAILRSFTVEPLVPLLRAAGFANGLDLTVQIGEFNAYAQEILDPHSALYRFKP